MPTINKNDVRTLHWKTKKGRGGAVLINRWINFYKILLMDLLELHQDKKQKFIKHFLYNKTTRWLLEFKDLSRKEFTMRELKEAFKLRAKPRDRINKMLSLNLIKRRKINSKNTIYGYCLTESYFEFVNKLFDSPPLVDCDP